MKTVHAPLQIRPVGIIDMKQLHILSNGHYLCSLVAINLSMPMRNEKLGMGLVGPATLIEAMLESNRTQTWQTISTRSRT